MTRKINRTLTVQHVKNSVDPLIDILVISNKRRLDNLFLDQLRDKAVRTVLSKCSNDDIEQIEKAQNRFERTLQIKFQLDKLNRRLNENMPPPALNIIDKLEFRSKELSKENKEQYIEQWNNIIRKTKLELTSAMRLGKTAGIEKSEREHQEVVRKNTGRSQTII